MKVYYDEPKDKFKVTRCSRCGQPKLCTWHHIYRRRYGKEWTWLCIWSEENNFTPSCHQWVHDNPAKARELGLYKTQTHMIKKIKKVKCKKHMPVFNRYTGKIECQFCRIEIKNPVFLDKQTGKKIKLRPKKK